MVPRKRAGVRMLQATAVISVVFAFLASGAWAQPSTSASDVTDPKIQYQLKLEKVKAENLALQVMLTYQPTSEVYQQAQRFYTDAQQKFNAYTSTLLTMLKSGKKHDMTEIAKEAGAAAQRFSDYVNEKLPATRSPALIPVVAGVLLDLAERLWRVYSEGTQAKRAALAAELEPKITWNSWSHLTAGG
jgi:hypothetical protein